MQKNSGLIYLASNFWNVLLQQRELLKKYFFLLFLCLSGCASFSPSASLPAFSTNPLSSINAFQVQGSLSATNAEGHGGVAYFQWLQTPKQWKISVFGPFGIDRIEIVDTPYGVLLKTPHYSVRYSSPELLLQKTLGVKVPVPQLKYWLQGLPDPTLRYTVISASADPIQGFTQQSWRVSYLSRMHYKNFTLPQSIMITDGKNKLKVSITRWQF